MFHPDAQLEALHRVSFAIAEAQKVRRNERRAALRVSVGARLVAAGVKLGGPQAASRVVTQTQETVCA